MRPEQRVSGEGQRHTAMFLTQVHPGCSADFTQGFGDLKSDTRPLALNQLY
jgi:hypothetical protein